MATERQKKAVKNFENKYKEFDGTFLYLIRCEQFYKIGITFNIDSRLNSLQCGNPYELELVWSAKIKDAIECEELLHGMFEKKRHMREWFKLDKEDIEFILNLVE